MALQKTNALVLNLTDLKEYDEIVTLLTEDHGLVQVVAKGSRRAKGKNRGIFEVPYRVEVIYYAKEERELFHLQQASTLETFSKLRDNLGSLAAAIFLAEVTRLSLHPEDDATILYHRLGEALEVLSTGVKPLAEIVAYLRDLLIVIGLEPDVEECVSCGGSEQQPPVAFSPSAGGLLCQQCLHEDPQAFRLGEADRRLLQDVFLALEAETWRVGVTIYRLQSVRHLLLKHLEFHLGVRSKSVEFLRDVEGQR